MFRVTVSGPREQEASFFTVVVWRDQAEHVAESLSKGSRIVVVGRLQQRSWTAEDSSARSIVEVVADELGPSLRVGNGDHDQDGAEPASVASSISAVGERDASEGAACQRSAPSLLILQSLVRSFSTNSRSALWAASGRPPAATRRSPGRRPHLPR
jgi:single stranded DNA-binding protein